jgi:hypothetical protein
MAARPRASALTGGLALRTHMPVVVSRRARQQVDLSKRMARGFRYHCDVSRNVSNGITTTSSFQCGKASTCKALKLHRLFSSGCIASEA